MIRCIFFRFWMSRCIFIRYAMWRWSFVIFPCLDCSLLSLFRGCCAYLCKHCGISYLLDVDSILNVSYFFVSIHCRLAYFVMGSRYPLIICSSANSLHGTDMAIRPISNIEHYSLHAFHCLSIFYIFCKRFATHRFTMFNFHAPAIG